MKTNPNQPLVSILLGDPNANYVHSYGLTKREYFAAIAMNATISNLTCGHADAVKQAVWIADALIEELNK